MRSWKFLLPLLASTLCFAAQPDRIAAPLASGQVITLPGHIHRYAQSQYDQGRVEPSFQLNQMTLLTLPSPSQKAALSALVADQQNPRSPNFHKWLTPEQYANRFGLSQSDVQKISGWLKTQGLTVASVARGRNWIVFNGTAAQVESAFRTEIHHYSVRGEIHYANATMPSIPASLSGIAAGIRGLDDFRPKPAHVRRAQSSRPNFYDNSFTIPDFVAPGDIATIYDLTPLYNAGFDGTGQKLVIVGETDVYLADLNDFRNGFGLTPITGCTTNSSDVITACNTTGNFQYVLDGADPGVATPASDILTEADLDLEWSAATARGAQIIYVNSTDVFTSYYYAIDNKLAPVISMSFGDCEFDDNNLAADEVELLKSNSFGITFMNSSGDSGAAECDDPTNTATSNLATGGLAVSYPASSPEVTGVGGTAIAYPTGFTSTFWSTTNGTFPNGGTAQNPPLPETSWNDDVELAAAFGGTALSIQQSYAIVSSGGGASNCSVQTSDNSNCVSGFPQPSWQTVTIPSQASARFSPDVSLLGSPNFPGYIYCTPVEELSTTSPYDTETTSTCATSITDAVNGVVSGSTTIVSPSVVGGTSASSPVFAGIVTILNQYLAGVSSGGLGNINPTLYTLAETPGNAAFHQVKTGTNVVYCEPNQPPAPWPTALQCPASGSFGYSASNADATTGYNLVTGLGSVDANNVAIAWKDTLTPDFALSPSPTSVSVAAGQSVTATVTISPIAGSAPAVINFSPSSCTGLPAGASCAFSPTSVTFNGTNSPATALTISTLPTMALPTTAQTITVTPTSPSNVITTVSLTVTKTTETFSIASTNGVTFPVSPGGTASVSIALTGTAGFVNTSNNTTEVPVTYSCSGIPTTAEIACNLTPGNGQAISTNAVTLNLVTTAPTAQLHPPTGRATDVFYALLLPGLFGIVFLGGGSRTRGVRLLSLIVVLGFSTLWMGACGGGSNGSQKNPGTPAGSYSVTVNAVTAGSVPISNTGTPLTITLTVN